MSAYVAFVTCCIYNLSRRQFHNTKICKGKESTSYILFKFLAFHIYLSCIEKVQLSEFNCLVLHQCSSIEHFWKRCFLKTSVSNGIIYTKYTQNPHIIEPPFNIATQSATYTVTACVSRWEPNDINANNPCPAARQKQYWYFISLLRFSALKCKPNGQKNVVVLENLIIESLHMIETEL